MKKYSLILLMAALLSSPTVAQNAGFNYGLGTKSCGEFARDYAAHPDMVEPMYFAWAEGFLSGMNFEAFVARAPSKLLLGGSPQMTAYKQTIRVYCDAHPLAAYSDAVTALWQTLPWAN